MSRYIMLESSPAQGNVNLGGAGASSLGLLSQNPRDLASIPIKEEKFNSHFDTSSHDSEILGNLDCSSYIFNSKVAWVDTSATDLGSGVAAFEQLQSQQAMAFITPPYLASPTPSASGWSWGFNSSANSYPLTPPLGSSVIPDPQCTLYRHTFPGRLVEVGFNDAVYSVETPKSQYLSDSRSESTLSMADSTYGSRSPGSPQLPLYSLRTWSQDEKPRYRQTTRTFRKESPKSFVCLDCSKNFTRNGDLRRHEHTKHHVQNAKRGGLSRGGNKPYRTLLRKCPHPRCNTISRLDNLPKHVERRHPEVWDAVTERNPHAVWYDRCFEYCRRRDRDGEMNEWVSR